MRWFLCMTVLLTCSVQSLAGIGSADGTEPEFWGKMAVVVCEVQ